MCIWTHDLASLDAPSSHPIDRSKWSRMGMLGKVNQRGLSVFDEGLPCAAEKKHSGESEYWLWPRKVALWCSDLVLKQGACIEGPRNFMDQPASDTPDFRQNRLVGASVVIG